LKLPDTIADRDPRAIRQMFQDWMAKEMAFDWNGGNPIMEARSVAIDLIAQSLRLSDNEAQAVQSKLVEEGWIEPLTFVPSMRGMALAQHIDRAPISREKAEEILEEVLDWTRRVNGQHDARIKIRKIDLFGSLEQGASEVGDIDLFVDFTTMDLGDDLQPKDFDQQAELGRQLVSISEYISPSSELDRLMMDVPTRRIFTL
jgi:predicted nucleotidyltransferase